jgi:hypothetical protein
MKAIYTIVVKLAAACLVTVAQILGQEKSIQLKNVAGIEPSSRKERV